MINSLTIPIDLHRVELLQWYGGIIRSTPVWSIPNYRCEVIHLNRMVTHWMTTSIQWSLLVICNVEIVFEWLYETHWHQINTKFRRTAWDTDQIDIMTSGMALLMKRTRSCVFGRNRISEHGTPYINHIGASQQATGNCDRQCDVICDVKWEMHNVYDVKSRKLVSPPRLLANRTLKSALSMVLIGIPNY